MKFIADLQVHSRFSRATSKNLNLENLEKYAKIKGLNLLGTGDITHPEWLNEIKSELTEDGSGVLTSKSGFKFILQGEISNIYSQGGKGRRIHNLIFAPSIEVVEQIQQALLKKGRIDYDGRPIFGFSCPELVEMMKRISSDIEIVPAHCLIPGTMIQTPNNVCEIEKLKKNDLVFSHTGKVRKITETKSRNYDGTIYHVKLRYFSLGIKTTQEHPFYCIKTHKNCSWTGGICKPTFPHLKRCVTNAHEEYKPEWVEAKDLQVGDVILYPRIQKTKDKQWVKIGSRSIKATKDFCRLIGYYLAEGYSNGRDGIGFSFGKHEKELISDTKYLIKKIFGLHVKNGKTFGDIILYSKEIMHFFEDLCYNSETRRAFTKIVPDWMLYMPHEKQAELLKGWWWGDKGSTSSRQLMNHFKLICLRLGIVPAIRMDSKEDHVKRGKHTIKGRVIVASHDNYVFNNLTFFEDEYNLLDEECFSEFKRDKFKYGWIDKKYVYLPIRKIEKQQYKGKVYNLEVEEDNSYLSEFCTIHNCWTPWFSLFGSMSGFDSVKECFQDQTKHIHALETGMSSDPTLNRRISQLDNFTLISNSDAHSFWPWRLGREANIFDIKPTYKDLIKAIQTGKGLQSTIEVDPNYGKYHIDGHRDCNVRMEPSESNKHNKICPVCKKPMTIGVLNRIEELADRPEDYVHNSDPPFVSLIPLSEIISLVLEKGVTTQTVWKEYNKLIENFKDEFTVLLETTKEELEKGTTKEIASAIINTREGKTKIEPGYDGVYGKIVLNNK